jgi:hypothetical protein
VGLLCTNLWLVYYIDIALFLTRELGSRIEVGKRCMFVMIPQRYGRFR